MALFLITYDLRKQRNYDALLKQLRDWKCVRPALSVWLGVLRGPAKMIRDLLTPLIDSDDGLVVIELKPGSDWATLRALPGGPEWLRKYLHR